MKNHKTLILCGLLSLPLMAGQADAQPRNQAGPRPGMLDSKVARLQEQLELSDKQANQLYDVFKQKQDQGVCRKLEAFSERRDCKKANREGMDKTIASILTKDQQEKFNEIRNERRGGGSGDCQKGGKGRGGWFGK